MTKQKHEKGKKAKQKPQVKQHQEESRCVICGQNADGAIACMGCWQDAVDQGLIPSAND